MENLEDMVVFARVVEKGSFTAAARELRKSTSAVSKHVTRLEDALSLKLLHRSTHHLALTEPGSTFYEHCTRIIAELEQARADAAGVSGEVKGVLRVHSTPGVGQSLVSPAVMDFIESYQAATVELTISEISANVMKRGVDIMICSRYFGQDSTFHSSLIGRDLGPTSYAVCAAPAYFARAGVPGAPQELQAHNCLLHITQKRKPNEWQFAGKDADFTVRVTGSFRSDLENAVLAAALRGVGIARLPDYTASRELAAGNLQAIFPGQVRSDRVVKAFYPRSKYVPRKTRAFIECLDKRYKQTSVVG
jgi:DNA-binding transcriptional LysR family regulator